MAAGGVFEAAIVATLHCLCYGRRVLWEENREALVALPVAAGHMPSAALLSFALPCCAVLCYAMLCCAMLCAAGVAGVVLSAATGVPLAATIVVEGISHNTTANKLFGYFNRSAQQGVPREGAGGPRGC